MAGSTIGNKFTITTWGESTARHSVWSLTDAQPAFLCVRRIYRYFLIEENLVFTVLYTKERI